MYELLARLAGETKTQFHRKLAAGEKVREGEGRPPWIFHHPLQAAHEGLGEEEIMELVRLLNRRCEPALLDVELRRQVRGALKRAQTEAS